MMIKIIDNDYLKWYSISENDNYRQGATACIVKTHFETEPNLLVNFECLIDHQKILLKIN